MRIHIHLHGILRDLLPPPSKGKAIINLSDHANISDLLTHLNITRRVEVSINDMLIQDQTQVLNEDDKVVIFTVIGGGQVINGTKLNKKR